MLVVADSDPDIAAAIIQVPGLSARAGFLVNVLVAGRADALAGVLRRPPRYRPVVGDPGEGAVITDSHAKSVMLELADHDPTWRNEIALRGRFAGDEPRARDEMIDDQVTFLRRSLAPEPLE